MALIRVPKPGEIPGNSKRRVLYVEDDDVNWAVAELELQRKYSIERAKNAREAFETMADNPFDMVLMDIELAGSDLDGIAIVSILKGRYGGLIPSYAQWVAKSPPRMPIVFVTAYTGRYDRNALIAAGGDEVISKPVNFTQLALVMARLVTKHL